MATEEEETTIFDKLSTAFKTAMSGMNDLMEYFENVIKKFINSIAIMLVTSFVMPLFILIIFRWLIKELFSLNLSLPQVKILLPGKNKGEKAASDLPQKEEA